MPKCRKCDAEITFRKEYTWIAPINTDGSYHKCGKVKDNTFRTSTSGVIKGRYFVEPNCDCIPWIGCDICCPYVMTIEQQAHLDFICPTE